MWRFTLVLAALALLLCGVGQAKADTIQTFNASGTFADGATLSGILTIDVTTGVATAVDLVVGPPDSLTFSFIQQQVPSGADGYLIQTGTAASGVPQLDLILATTTLVNYSGSSIASGSEPVDNRASEILVSTSPSPVVVLLSQGSLSAAPAAAPAAASLTLLGAGAVGLLGYGWRKRKRAAA
jgi:hypothetical protein